MLLWKIRLQKDTLPHMRVLSNTAFQLGFQKARLRTTPKNNIYITEFLEQEILALLSSTNIWPIFKW